MVWNHVPVKHFGEGHTDTGVPLKQRSTWRSWPRKLERICPKMFPTNQSSQFFIVSSWELQRLYMPSSVFVQFAKHCNRLPPFLHLWHLCMVIMVVIVVIVVFVVFMVFMRTTFRTIAMEVLVVRSVVVMALCKEPAQSCLKSQKRRESQYFGG